MSLSVFGEKTLVPDEEMLAEVLADSKALSIISLELLSFLFSPFSQSLKNLIGKGVRQGRVLE